MGEKQELFARLFATLILKAYELGYQVRIGDVFAHDGHKEKSNHYIKMAGDINLFKDGVYLDKTEDHRILGEWWEQQHELCRWGGWFDDGGHYSLIHNGRM